MLPQRIESNLKDLTPPGGETRVGQRLVNNYYSAKVLDSKD